MQTQETRASKSDEAVSSRSEIDARIDAAAVETVGTEGAAEPSLADIQEAVRNSYDVETDKPKTDATSVDVVPQPGYAEVAHAVGMNLMTVRDVRLAAAE